MGVGDVVLVCGVVIHHMMMMVLVSGAGGCVCVCVVVGVIVCD